MSKKIATSHVRSFAALAALLFLTAANVLIAQTSTSIISGTVTDSSGAIVAGAKVDVRNAGTGMAISPVPPSKTRPNSPSR